MKKWRGWILLILIILILAILIWLIKAPVLSAYISDKMNVPVSMRSIHMNTKSSQISHFRILNPNSFRQRTALEVDRTKVSYRFQKLMSTPSEIDEIICDGVYLYIEVPRSKEENNWAVIASQIPDRKRGDKSVLVHKLILRNFTVETRGAGAKALGVAGVRHFDQMEFTEIDSAQGFPTEELIQKVFINAGIQEYIQNLLNPANQIKRAFSPLKKMFGGE